MIAIEKIYAIATIKTIIATATIQRIVTLIS